MAFELSDIQNANLSSTQHVISSPFQLANGQRSEDIQPNIHSSVQTRQLNFSNVLPTTHSLSYSEILSKLHQPPTLEAVILRTPSPIEPILTSTQNIILPGSELQTLNQSPSKLDAYHHVSRSRSASPAKLTRAEAEASPPNTARIRLPTLSPLRCTTSLPSIASALTSKLAMDEKSDSPFALREKHGDSTPTHLQPTTHTPQHAGTPEPTVNPYETDPENIPKTDKFLMRHPHHGRYLPRDDDFIPDERHIQSTSLESVEYWKGVLSQCNPRTRINVPREGKRDTFALGSVIVKSDHLNTFSGADYSVPDENEEIAVRKAVEVLSDIELPQTYFRSKIGDRDVLVQSRIAGTSLEVAWPYLTTEQKANFKEQARNILRRICQLKWNDPRSLGYIVPGDHEQGQRASSSGEVTNNLLKSSNLDLAVSHNDMVPSNIIVNNDKIVGIVGWANMGCFSWRDMSEVHSKQRCVHETDTPIAELFEHDVPWHDLYNITPEGLESNDATTIKIEASTPIPEMAPGLSTAGTPRDAPTPKKIIDLKRKSVSRATSSERSSPIPPSSSQQPSKKRAPPTTAAKKGTAKRNPPPKKRKLNDTASTDDIPTPAGGASTPRSRMSKTPAQRSRKQSSLSVRGSPAAENRKATGKRDQDEMDLDDEDADQSEIFCVCRKPDNHTWMIGCDGGCEDWFHGKCMNLNQADADLIDKYICPSCEKTCGMHTTWKPMCRYQGCRQPARVNRKAPSKYCSDTHGKDSIVRRIEIGTPQLGTHDTPPITPGLSAKARSSSAIAEQARLDSNNLEGQRENDSIDQGKDQSPNDDENEGTEEDIGSRGGILTVSELKAVVSRVKSADEFRKLGESPLTPRQAELKARLDALIATPITNNENGVYVEDPVFKAEADKVEFSSEERQQLQDLRILRAKIGNFKDMLHDRERFLGIARQRAKLIFERAQRNGFLTGIQWKDVCGFDERLSWSDVEFDEWRKSGSGKKVLNEDTDKDQGGEDPVDAETVESLTQDLCLKKRCERHKKWLATMQQDALFEQELLKEQQEKCQEDAEEVVKKAVIRVFGEGD